MAGGLSEIFTLSKPKQVEAVGGVGKGLAEFFFFQASDATVHQALELHLRLSEILYQMLDSTSVSDAAEYGDLVLCNKHFEVNA